MNGRTGGRPRDGVPARRGRGESDERKDWHGVGPAPTKARRRRPTLRADCLAPRARLRSRADDQTFGRSDSRGPRLGRLPYPALVGSNRFEASQCVERSPGVEPNPRGEDRIGIVPAPLSPCADSEPMEAAKEGPIVDHPPREHAAEPDGKRVLGNAHAGLVELESRARPPGIEGDEPEMSPRVDAPNIPRLGR